MKKTLLFFFIFTPLLINAQTKSTKIVSGTIVSTTTQETIPFVTILLKNKSETKTAIADENGQFSIEKLHYLKYVLSINAIGYKSYQKQLDFGKTSFINLEKIYLKENIEALDAVVIRAETSVVKQEIDRVVINVGKDLTNMGTDAASVLNNVQSVSVDQQTGELSLRGNSNVRVLIDGKPTNIPTDQLLKQLPSNAIKNIELITNPSAKYNPEGNSGIINIELIKNSTYGFNGSINTSATMGRNLRGSQGFNMNYKKGNINLYTNYNYRSGKNDIIGSLLRPKDNVQETYGLNIINNHFFKLGTDIDLNKKTSLSVFTLQAFNKKSYTNITEIKDLPDYTTKDKSVFSLDRKPRNQNYDISLRKVFDEKKHILDIGISYNIRKQPEKSSTIDLLNLTKKATNYTEAIHATSKRTFVNLDYAKPFANHILIETGLQYRYYQQNKHNQSTQLVNNSLGEIVPSGLSDFKFNRHIYSAYFNYKQQFDKLGVQAGLRAERYILDAYFDTDITTETQNAKDQKTSLYPSFFATYNFNKKDQFQFSYSRRVDRPSIKQLTPIRTWGTPLLVSQGNPNLKQQFTNSLELKYNRKLTIGNVSFTTFYRNINDVISRSISSDELVAERVILSYANFDNSNQYGIELSGNLKLANWWRFNTSADLYYQKQEGLVQDRNTDTRTFIKIEVDNILLNFRTHNNFKITKNLNLQMTHMYRGLDKNVQRDRKPMFLMNLASSYKILKEKGTVTLGFSDVFNTFKARFNIINPIAQNGEFNWESQKITLGFVYNFGKKFKIDKKRRPREERESGGDVF